MEITSNSLSLSANSSILNRVKEGYLIWMNIVPHIPRSGRFTIGSRIENKFLDLLELTYTAYFTEKDKKKDKLSDSIFTTDIIKFLISNKQYEDIALKMDEIGKMFWGWKKSLDPQLKNPARSGEKK